jgi:hypothetical protein
VHASAAAAAAATEICISVPVIDILGNYILILITLLVVSNA